MLQSNRQIRILCAFSGRFPMVSCACRENLISAPHDSGSIRKDVFLCLTKSVLNWNPTNWRRQQAEHPKSIITGLTRATVTTAARATAHVPPSLSTTPDPPTRSAPRAALPAACVYRSVQAAPFTPLKLCSAAGLPHGAGSLEERPYSLRSPSS